MDLLGCIKYRYTTDPWDFVSSYPFSKWQTTPMNFPVYRFADALLMLAEIDNELSNGPSALALECINAVRNRARGTTDDTETPNFKIIAESDYDKDSDAQDEDNPTIKLMTKKSVSKVIPIIAAHCLTQFSLFNYKKQDVITEKKGRGATKRRNIDSPTVGRST